MKKIININLSGRVIPIEDSAYESLQNYIESLRRYFAHEEGKDEIINDIESRIAELMNDKVRKGAPAITDADIEEIINAMGRIEDFEAVDETTTSTGASAAPQADEPRSQARFKGRLYRDESDKIIGGVCSGIANYMNVDPAVVRLLFAIITFGGFGFGFLIYIILWIVLPVRKLETYTGKRFFRNPDDRILAGVAGGLAAYFNKPAWAVRLIFAAPLILNIVFAIFRGVFFPFHSDIFPNIFVGSFTGTFILAYIILWIVMPLANTPYEKMEMRGEKVDVNRIRQNVQEGMSDFKTRMQSWGNEVKDTAQQLGQKAGDFASSRSRAFASEVSGSVRSDRGLGYVIGVLFKAFFIFIAGVIGFGLFVFFIVIVLGGGTALWPAKKHLLDFAIVGFWQNTFFWGTLFFFFAIPLIAFLTWLVRRIMRVRSQRHYLGYVFGGLWFIGFICLIGLVSSIARDARRLDRVEQEVAIFQPAGKLTVSAPFPEVRYDADSWFVDEDINIDVDADTLRITDIRVRINKSEDSNYKVVLHKYSRGATRSFARQRAERIQYHASYSDSTLLLGSGLAIDKESKYRGQRVIVEISVPEGKKIRFDETLRKLDRSPVRMRERGRWDRDEDIDWSDDHFFEWKYNVDYVMNANGHLLEAGISDSIRTDTTPANDSLQKIRDEQKRVRDSIDNELEKTEQQMNRRTGMYPSKKEENGFIQMPYLSILI